MMMKSGSPSKILELIKSDPNWRETVNSLNIKVKERGDLAIFNYGADCDWNNPIVREARGIIIDLQELQVICWSFNKFFNIQEEFATPIDWSHCRVEEKIDGSIVKLYYYQGEWRWATNSCIDASEAPIRDSSKTYLDIIKSALNYNDINPYFLLENYTYTFELVSPETQVVIKYAFPCLIHIGTRNNETGQEVRVNINIRQPDLYSIHSEEECLKRVRYLNCGHDTVTYEGFVVVDSHWNRVKIKSPEYLELHHTWNNGSLTPERAVEVLRLRKDPIEEICDVFPGMAPKLTWYYYQLTELTHQVERYINYVRGLYLELGKDKKALALQIKDHRYSGFGFEAIKLANWEKSAEDLLAELPESKVAKWLRRYEEPDIFGGGSG